MTLNEVYRKLKEEGREIGQAAKNGDERARRVIEMYQFLYKCPGDPCAQALLVESYKEYKEYNQEKEKRKKKQIR